MLTVLADVNHALFVTRQQMPLSEPLDWINEVREEFPFVSEATCELLLAGHKLP